MSQDPLLSEKWQSYKWKTKYSHFPPQSIQGNFENSFVSLETGKMTENKSTTAELLEFKKSNSFEVLLHIYTQICLSNYEEKFFVYIVCRPK